MFHLLIFRKNIFSIRNIHDMLMRLIMRIMHGVSCSYIYTVQLPSSIFFIFHFFRRKIFLKNECQDEGLWECESPAGMVSHSELYTDIVRIPLPYWEHWPLFFVELRQKHFNFAKNFFVRNMKNEELMCEFPQNCEMQKILNFCR